MHTDTWYAIVNPAAGKGRAVRICQQLSEAMQHAGLKCVFAESQSQGHATVLAQDAIRDGYRRFLSIGGDGTHHEVANGLIRRSPDIEPLLAIVRAGTGNDLVRMHRLPHKPDEIVRMLIQGASVTHDAGLISCMYKGQRVSRYFINVAGMALDGRVVETFPALFRRIAFLPGYLIAGVRQLLWYRPQGLTISGGDHQLEGRFYTVHAGICKFSGDGMQFVPHADPQDGQLAITCVPRMPRARLLAQIYRLYNGSLPAHPLVRSWKCTHLQVHATADSPVPIEADGEFLGYTPVSIEIFPSAFRLIVHGV